MKSGTKKWNGLEGMGSGTGAGKALKSADGCTQRRQKGALGFGRNCRE